MNGVYLPFFCCWNGHTCVPLTPSFAVIPSKNWKLFLTYFDRVNFETKGSLL